MRNKRMKALTNLIYVALTTVSFGLGAVTANGELGDLFASLTGTGENGGGFIYRYTPTGVQSTLASGISRPHGVALDHFANLFVASTTLNRTSYQGTIFKITPLGVQSTFASVGREFCLDNLQIYS